MSFIKIKYAFRLSQFYASPGEVPSNPVSLVLTTPFPNTHTQTQLQGACGPSGVGGEKVLEFWLHILLACPNWYDEISIIIHTTTYMALWILMPPSTHPPTHTRPHHTHTHIRYREGSILHILDALCMATHSQEQWQSSIQSVLLEAYKVRAKDNLGICFWVKMFHFRREIMGNNYSFW